MSEWTDNAGESAEHAVRFTLHNPISHAVVIDSAAIMMGDDVLFPLSSYAQNRIDVRRFPLHLAAGRSESFDFRPPDLANLVAKHGGRGKVILHGEYQLVDVCPVKGCPIVFDTRRARSPPFKRSLTVQGPLEPVWAWISGRYPRVQMVKRRGLAGSVVYLTYQQMLAIRQQADTRDLPNSTYRGQPIIDFSMWKTGDASRGGIWRAVLVLADKTRLELVEDRDRMPG
jgi:hypothetical protein